MNARETGPETLACRLDGYTDLPPGKLANVVTYFEMRSPAPRRAAPDPALALAPTTRDRDAYRALYRLVGGEWLWSGRLVLSDAALDRALRDPALVSRTLLRAGEPIGLVEVVFHGEGPGLEAELLYCGVAPEAIGTGAAAHLVDFAVAQAFARPIVRLFVHTCTLDHPAAVPFYLKSGFVPYKRAIEIHDDPRLAGHLPRAAAARRWPAIGRGEAQ